MLKRMIEITRKDELRMRNWEKNEMASINEKKNDKVDLVL